MRTWIRCPLLVALPVFAGALFCAAPALPAAAQQAPPRITIESQPVFRGCNSIVVQAPLGTAWRDIVSHFSDPASVIGVWRFDNPSQRYQGVFFPDANAPLDGPPSTIAPVFGIFACVSANGSVG